MENGSDLNLVALMQEPRFRDPLSAAEYLEGIRWPNGNVCPKCGDSERKHYKLPHKTRRLWKCAACRKQYTVTVGTIFEASHVSLDKWLLAFYLLCSSKKGMSAHQLHRSLGVTYKTAWFMFHRIREAMKDPAFSASMSGTVEVDETFIGGKPRAGQVKTRKQSREWGIQKTKVVALVERDGKARSFRAANLTAETLQGAVRRHVEPGSRVMTDEFKSYKGLRVDYDHHSVNHGADEYVRGDVTTNSVESYFATLKRGVNGTYHRISEAHLPRYLAEFDFRFNTRGQTDGQRTIAALSQAEGKRLKYRETR